MHDCVSVWNTHCLPLCFVSHFLLICFPHFSPLPLYFPQTDVLLFWSVQYFWIVNLNLHFFLFFKMVQTVFHLSGHWISHTYIYIYIYLYVYIGICIYLYIYTYTHTLIMASRTLKGCSKFEAHISVLKPGLANNDVPPCQGVAFLCLLWELKTGAHRSSHTLSGPRFYVCSPVSAILLQHIIQMLKLTINLRQGTKLRYTLYYGQLLDFIIGFPATPFICGSPSFFYHYAHSHSVYLGLCTCTREPRKKRKELILLVYFVIQVLPVCF